MAEDLDIYWFHGQRLRIPKLDSSDLPLTMIDETGKCIPVFDTSHSNDDLLSPDGKIINQSDMTIAVTSDSDDDEFAGGFNFD